MKLFELIDELVEFKQYGDCDVVVEDGTVSLMQDPVVRIVCDESVSKYGIFNNNESMEAVMGKTVKGKDKLKAKLDAAKKKIARKVKGACVIAFALILVGCQQTPQASRATSAQYGDWEPNIKIVVDERACNNHISVPISITVGDGALASADSSGSTEAQTASPTQDIKPDLDVNYNGPSKVASGALETVVGAGAKAAAKWMATPSTNQVQGAVQSE